MLSKAIGHAGAARLAALGELSADVALATPAQIREMVASKVLPLQAIATLDVLSAEGALPVAEVERLLQMATEVLADCSAGA